MISLGLKLALSNVGGGETLEEPDANYVFVYNIDNQQVFTNTDQAVQVPDNYANS